MEENKYEHIDVNAMSKKDFENLEFNYKGEEFNLIVIIPTKRIHDSEYRIMKFAFFNNGSYVGSIDGSSDVLHFGGIGNEYLKAHCQIDCLRKSHYLRIWINKKCVADTLGLSDFSFYIKEN